MLLHRDRIRKTALALQRKYHTTDPFRIADELNVAVQYGPLGKYAGCYMYLKKHRCIFLNTGNDEQLMRMVMAHELGHAIFHMNKDCCFIQNHTLFLTSRFELQANMFTAELLIPDSILCDYAYCSVYDIASRTGLSIELVKYRLEGLQLTIVQ